MKQEQQLSAIKLPLPNIGTTKLKIFEKTLQNKATAVRFSLIFGKNGSGKSSIARGISNPENTCFLTPNGTVLTSFDPSNIFVFNEDYIDTHFKPVDSHGLLQPIILLGQGAIDANRIEEIENENRSHQKTLEAEETKLEKCNDELKSQENLIRNFLTSAGKTSWQTRTTYYDEKRNRQRLNTNVIKKISKIQIEHLDPLPTLEQNFDETIQSLQKALEHRTIAWSIPKINFPYNLTEIENDINEVTKTSLLLNSSNSELLQRIEDVKRSTSELKQISAMLGEETTSYCPTCFQDLSDSHKLAAQSAINFYLEKLDENSAIAKLRSHIVGWESSFSVPSDISNEEAAENFIHAQTELNKIIRNLEERLDTKANNPREEISITDIPIEGSLETFKKAIDALEQRITELNKLPRQKRNLRETAATLNQQIAAYGIKDYVKKTEELEEAKSEILNTIEGIKDQQETLNSELDSIKAKEKSETEAAKRVNQLLSLVFGNAGMSLEATKSGYRVKNRTSEISPKNLSTGERNILSLCYFLVSLANEKHFDTCFKESQVIILDDPVSSFDTDNKYGTIALLNWLTSQCILTESKTKLCILTHDPEVAYILAKQMNGNANGNNCNWELRDGKLEKFKPDDYDFYRSHLQQMYDFATNQSVNKTDLTSNAVRRVWEAFSLFYLGENMTDVFKSDKVSLMLEKKPNNIKNFCKTFVVRSFIHLDSHAEVQIKTCNYALQPALTDNDFHRYVKELLSFMHTLAPSHISSRLAKKKEEIQDIELKLQSLVESVTDHYPL